MAEDTFDRLSHSAPLLASSLRSMYELIHYGRLDELDPEELITQASVFSRLELPAQLAQKVQQLTERIVRDFIEAGSRGDVEIDIYDGKIWPRGDEREGCCLLMVTAEAETGSIEVFEPLTEEVIWSGEISPNQSQFVRWIVERDEGFIAQQNVDISLALRKKGKETAEHVVAATVPSKDPVWPTYPTGALSPDDVLGNELYGRTPLLRKLAGRFRARGPTVFIEGPRQIGKTSLLHFLKELMPGHVIPLYVNCEQFFDRRFDRNPWSFLGHIVAAELKASPVAAQAIKEAEDDAKSALSQDDFETLTAALCSRFGKDYMVLFLDDFHALLDHCADPRALLSAFRLFLNDASKNIAIVFGDRYSTDELAKRYEHELWAQILVERVGPLSLDATSKAITSPTLGTDVVFLRETILTMHRVTSGYPYHIQRLVNYVLDDLWESGPWLTVLPEDVDRIVERMIREDQLFQVGLCRPDRIDLDLQRAIVALVEAEELAAIWPILQEDPEWREALDGRNWRIDQALAGMENPKNVVRSLDAVGVLRRTPEGGYEFFSPLLLEWLRRMRDEGIPISAGSSTNPWTTVQGHDISNLTGQDLLQLDIELNQKALRARKEPPLRERAFPPSKWNRATDLVNDEDSFRDFVSNLFDVFVDGRENSSALSGYPLLSLAYHRIRLIRNYLVHGSPTRSACDMWDMTIRVAIGRRGKALLPRANEEWRALQITILRSLISGYENALALLSIEA